MEICGLYKYFPNANIYSTMDYTWNKSQYKNYKMDLINAEILNK